MDALECIKTRHSVRRYASDPVDKETIVEIVNAGRLAASAINIQPWEFVVVTDKETREKLAGIMDYGKFIAQAPVCIVTFCKEGEYYLEDGCAASQNMLLAARALGLSSCWVAGDKKPYAADVCKVLGAPENYKLISSIAIGKAAGEIKHAPKRSVEEVLHWDRF